MSKDGKIVGPKTDEELAKIKKGQKHQEKQAKQTNKGLHDLDPGSPLYEAVKEKNDRQEAEAQNLRIRGEIQHIYDSKEK